MIGTPGRARFAACTGAAGRCSRQRAIVRGFSDQFIFLCACFSVRPSHRYLECLLFSQGTLGRPTTSHLAQRAGAPTGTAGFDRFAAVAKATGSSGHGAEEVTEVLQCAVCTRQ